LAQQLTPNIVLVTHDRLISEQLVSKSFILICFRLTALWLYLLLGTFVSSLQLRLKLLSFSNGSVSLRVHWSIHAAEEMVQWVLVSRNVVISPLLLLNLVHSSDRSGQGRGLLLATGRLKAVVLSKQRRLPRIAVIVAWL